MSSPDNLQNMRKRPGIIARLFHGTGAGAIGYGLNIASNLLLLPLYLHSWSVAVYGEWMALYSVVNYLGSLDFGVTTAAVNAATVAHARQDWPVFKRIQGTAWAASLAIAGLGALVVAAIAALYFHVDSWLGLKEIDHHDARLIVCGLTISLLANIPGRQLAAIFTATGEFAKSQWLTNAYTALTFVVTGIALFFDAGPVELAGVLAAATIGTILFSLLLLRRGGALLVPHLRDAQWSVARELAAPTGQIGLSMVASALTVQGPVVILSRMLGGPAVALFTTTRTITNAVRSVIVLLRAPLRPEFAAASVREDKSALRRLFRVAVSVDTAVALSLSAALWSGGLWLIQFWSHGKIHPDPRLLHLLLLSVLFEGFLQIVTVVGWATNKIKGVSIGLLLTALASLILATYLVGDYGSSAVPIGVLISLAVIMSPAALRNASTEAHISMRFITLRLFIPFAAIATIAVGISEWLASLSAIPWWIAASIATALTAALTVSTSAFIFLDKTDRQHIVQRMTTLVGSKRAENSGLPVVGG